MWEYKIRQISFKIYSDLIDELNSDGEEDWEIVNYEEKHEKSSNVVKVLYKRIKSINIIHPKKKILKENSIIEVNQIDSVK